MPDYREFLAKALGLVAPPKIGERVPLPPDRPGDPLVAAKDFVEGLLGVKQDPGVTASGFGALLAAALPVVGGVKALRTAATAAKAEQAAEAAERGIIAYHGSPHDFPPVNLIEMPDGTRLYHNLRELPQMPAGAKVIKEYPLGKFNMSKIGTGEGAQAYGHGLYVAESTDVGRGYRDTVGAKHSGGASKYDAEMKIGGKRVEDVYRALDNQAASVPADKAQYIYDRMAVLERLMQDGDVLGVRENASQLSPAAMSWFEKEVAPKFTRTGKLYQVRINASPDEFLDWDKPLSEQSEAVKKALQPHVEAFDAGMQFGAKRIGDRFYPVATPGPNSPDGVTQRIYKSHSYRTREDATVAAAKEWRLSTDGQSVMSRLARQHGPEKTTQWLLDRGVTGIKYLDAGSRSAGEGSRNYVVFDDSLIDILKKFGVVAPVVGALREVAKQNGGAVSSESVNQAILQAKKAKG